MVAAEGSCGLGEIVNKGRCVVERKKDLSWFTSVDFVWPQGGVRLLGQARVLGRIR